MKKTRFLSLALTGTLCVSLLAGCGGSGDGGGAAQTPDAANTSTVQENTGSAFKLGGTGPLTGDAAMAWLPSAAPRSPWMKSKRPAATFSSR